MTTTETLPARIASRIAYHVDCVTPESLPTGKRGRAVISSKAGLGYELIGAAANVLTERYPTHMFFPKQPRRSGRPWTLMAKAR